jgi:hypothetical protein
VIAPNSHFDIPEADNYRLLYASLLSGWKDGQKCSLAGQLHWMTVRVLLIHLDIVAVAVVQATFFSRRAVWSSSNKKKKDATKTKRHLSAMTKYEASIELHSE